MAIDPSHFINVGPHGTFKVSGSFHSTPESVDAIFARLRQLQAKKIAIHFHGGLVNEAKGMAVAEKMAPVYTKAGAHPVTFVWETGPGETIKNNLASIHRTELFQLLLRKILKKVLQKVGGDVGGRGAGGRITEADIEEELAKPAPFEDVRYETGARGGAANADLDIVEDEVAIELELEFEADQQLAAALAAPTTEFLRAQEVTVTPLDGSRGLFSSTKAAITAAKIVYRVLARFVQDRDHGLYPTVVEEILRVLYTEAVGGWIWAGMKHAAREMWLPNAGLSGVQQHAGRYFLESLAKHQAAHDLTVDLVGHSAGSIAILEMLSAMREKECAVSVRNVFFLAPACTIKRFHQCLVNGDDRWKQLRIFTMHDDFETKDRLLGPIYTRSLLYFISGLLEKSVDEPLLGMDRFLGGRPPFDEGEVLAVQRYVRDAQASRWAASVWSVVNNTAAEGFRTASISHGGFDDDPDTQASLVFMMQA